MAQATYEDVNLILKLYEMRREERMRVARAWFVGNFKPKTVAAMNELCPPGSEQNASMRMVTTYWNMVASFITAGVLNEELFFESGQELLLTWLRMEPFVAEARVAFSNPKAWKSLETVGTAYIAWMKKNSPGAFEALAARIG
jgi:hypothetical protein